MPTALDDPPRLDHADQVRMQNGAQAVRDDDGGAPVPSSPIRAS
jgi:hypothetical protein